MPVRTPNARISIAGDRRAGAAVERLPIDATSYRAEGQDSRVRFLILHYTAQPMAESLRLLTRGQVSSHYLISDETPARIYRLVDEDRRAWHAGASSWQDHSALNASSIGIEIVNAGHSTAADGSEGFAPYPSPQIDRVIALVRDVVARHQIRPEHVLGHSDIAPQRKVDPGPAFPWHRLAAEGLIAWPDPVRAAQALPAFESRLPAADWFQQALARHGYAVPHSGCLDEPTRRVVAAFQMKYRPACHDGRPDAETAALLQAIGAAP